MKRKSNEKPPRKTSDKDHLKTPLVVKVMTLEQYRRMLKGQWLPEGW